MADPEDLDLTDVLHKARVTLGTEEPKQEDSALAETSEADGAGSPDKVPPSTPIAAPSADDTAKSGEDQDPESKGESAASDSETPVAANEPAPLGPLAGNFLQLVTDREQFEREKSAFADELPMVEKIRAAKELFTSDPVAGARAIIAAVAGDKANDAEMALFDARTKQVIEGDSDIGKLSQQFRNFTNEQRERAAQETAEREKLKREADQVLERQRTATAVQSIQGGLDKLRDTHPALFRQRMYDPAEAVWSILQEQKKLDPKKLEGLSDDQLIAFGAQSAERYFNHVFPTTEAQSEPAAGTATQQTNEQAVRSDAAPISQVEASEVSTPEPNGKRKPILTDSDLEDYAENFIARRNRGART